MTLLMILILWINIKSKTIVPMSLQHWKVISIPTISVQLFIGLRHCVELNYRNNATTAASLITAIIPLKAVV